MSGQQVILGDVRIAATVAECVNLFPTLSMSVLVHTQTRDRDRLGACLRFDRLPEQLVRAGAVLGIDRHFRRREACLQRSVNEALRVGLLVRLESALTDPVDLLDAATEDVFGRVQTQPGVWCAPIAFEEGAGPGAGMRDPVESSGVVSDVL